VISDVEDAGSSGFRRLNKMFHLMEDSTSAYHTIPAPTTLGSVIHVDVFR